MTDPYPSQQLDQYASLIADQYKIGPDGDTVWDSFDHVLGRIKDGLVGIALFCIILGLATFL